MRLSEKERTALKYEIKNDITRVFMEELDQSLDVVVYNEKNDSLNIQKHAQKLF